MNSDQLKGRWTHFKGELRSKWGKFTNDDLTEIEGDYQKLVGKAQERYGDKKAEVLKWAEDWHREPVEAKRRMPAKKPHMVSRSR